MLANRETFVKFNSFLTWNGRTYIYLFFSNFFHCRINPSRDVILPLSLLTRIVSMRIRLLLPNVRSERVCRPVWESVYASRKIHEFNVTCRVRCRYVSIKWRHIKWQFGAGVARTANDCAHSELCDWVARKYFSWGFGIISTFIYLDDYYNEIHSHMYCMMHSMSDWK